MLRGQALQEALQWTEGRKLSRLDRDFLVKPIKALVSAIQSGKDLRKLGSSSKLQSLRRLDIIFVFDFFSKFDTFQVISYK